MSGAAMVPMHLDADRHGKLIELLTGYSVAPHQLSDHDRAVVLDRAQKRWTALLEAAAQASASGTLNDVPFEDFEGPARALHEALCRASMIRGSAGWSFEGWTADGRAVRHRVKVEGYERTGPKVEAEREKRAALAAVGRVLDQHAEHERRGQS